MLYRSALTLPAAYENEMTGYMLRCVLIVSPFLVRHERRKKNEANGREQPTARLFHDFVCPIVRPIISSVRSSFVP